jgi:hypothetical protein
MMIGLQMLGVIVGTYICANTIWRFTKGSRSATDLLLFSALGLTTVFLSVNPDSGNRLLNWIGLESFCFTASSLPVIAGFLVLMIVQLTTSAAASTTDRELTRLIQKTALDRFSKDFPIGPSKPIAVLIPAYNEADSIAAVIRNIPQELLGLGCDVIVINDGSTDETEAVARTCGAMVLNHVMNRGGGAALGTGYQLAQRCRIPYVVTIDADGQYVPDEIPRLLDPLFNGNFDFVVGSRLRGYYEGISDWRLGIRTIGLFFFNFAATILLCKPITDIPSGFRAIKTPFLSSMKLTQKQFHTSEFLVEAIRSNARFKEVPISFLKRRIGESKKPHSLRYGLGFFKAFFGAWLR